MADQTARGQFLWHDLYTSDPAAAHQFYGKAVGWKSQPFDADPNYVMFAGPKGPLGGAGKLAEGQPHWVAYVGTPDIAASVAKAKSLGGTVVTDVTSIPNGGSYAVLKDPQGAVFGMYQYASDPGARSAPQRGEVSWYELGTNDADGALSFYTNLFGWTEVAKHDMGADGFYHLFGWSGTAQNGGLFKKPAQWGPPGWTIYVRVKDMDSTVKKAKAAGATLINGPMEVPGGDWIAQFTDPQGAVFAVHVLKADLKAAAAAKPAEAAAAPAKAEAPKAAAPKAKKPAAAKKKAAAKTQASSQKSAKKPAKKVAKKAAKKAGKKKVAAKAKKSVKKAAKKKSPSRSTRGAKKKARKAK